MKKILFTALLAAFSFTTFAQRSGGDVVDVRLMKFDREAQTVTVEFNVEVDGKDVHTTDSWILTPKISTNAQSKLLPSVVINGNNKRKMAARAEKFGNSWYGTPLIIQNFRSNYVLNIHYYFEVPYEEWMRNSVLVIDKRLVRCSRHTAFSQNLGVINAPAPHQIMPHPSFITPVNTPERVLTAEAFVDFPVNVSVIRPTFRNNASELEKINSTLQKVRNFNASQIKSIYLTGFASPEGPYNNNARLARERTEALKNHISRNYGIASEIITTNYVPEDWGGLRRMVVDSNIEGKAEVLAIIDSSAEPDAKEAELRRLNGGRTFQTILRDMMPALRRTEYKVTFHSQEGAVVSKETALNEPELLNQYELFNAANQFGLNTPEAMRIYQFIERKFADDPVAQNNVAAFKITRGDFAGAKRNLDRASKNSGATIVNLGIIEMMNGNYDAAEKMFRQGASLGDPQATANLREITLRRQ